ncbi:hypothetical protein Tco_0002417 [Tanacetum coccineum]
MPDTANISYSEDTGSAHLLKIKPRPEWLGKKHLSKSDLEGPAFKVVKAFHENNISLQFQMEECHQLLINQVDLVNPEGHRLVPDVSKPLPIGGPPSQVTIQPQFFFNKDLEYLISSDTARRDALSLSKLKAANYPDFGLEELVPLLWIKSERDNNISAAYGIIHWWFKRKEFYITRHNAPSDRHAVRSHMRILSVASLKKFERYGYAFMKEIVIRRADYKEQCVGDLQLGIESYQTKLNITQPNWDASDFLFKEDYTIVSKLSAVIYRDRNEVKKMMRINEVHKFSDGTLTRVLDKLNHMVKDFRLFEYNRGMENRIWSKDDKRRSEEFIEVIKRRLKIRRIFRNLESFVRGSHKDGDGVILYQLRQVHYRMLILDQHIQRNHESSSIYQEKYEYVGLQDTRPQDGERSLDDDQRLDLADDLKKAQDHISNLKSKEATLQVVYDVLKLTPFYKAFQIIADVLEIYMQEFWATTAVHHHSIRFKMNNKKHIVNLEYFREMLQICLKLPNLQFEELPFEEAILTFLRDLSHSSEIKMITDVNVNNLRLSQAQILWGMYHKKNVDYAYLLWEDFVYQVENKNVKKSNEMDDYMFTKIKVVFMHEDTHLYGAILPNELTNEDIKNSESYKEYYVIASGAEPPKTKARVKKKQVGSDMSNTSPTKGKRLKTSAKVAKTTKKKQPAKTSKAKGLTVLSEKSSEEDDDDDEVNFSTHDEDDNEEEGSDLRVQTPSHYESTNDEESGEVTNAVHTSDRLRDEAQAKNADFINKLDDNIKKIIKDQVKEQVKAQVSKILPKIKKTVNEQLEAEVLTCLSNESKTSHAIAANLFKLELKKILIDKMESNKSIHISDEQKNLYKALVDAYKSDKLILNTYKDTVTFKRRRDDEDKDKDPSTGSNRGSKRRRVEKNQSQPSAGESAQVEEPMHTAKDLEDLLGIKGFYKFLLLVQT